MWGLSTTLYLLFTTLCTSFATAFQNIHHIQPAMITTKSPVSIGQTRSYTSKVVLFMSDDEVQALLEKAKKLREEAAAMSGKTLNEVEAESKREKKLLEDRQREMQTLLESNGDSRKSASRIIPVPDDSQSMVQQAASAIERAFKDGKVRQTVRFALLTEDEEMSGEQNEWPGGAKQMFREAGCPLTEALLREVYVGASGQSSVSSTITTKDVWDFDGSAICKATSENSESDVTALIFPNTDAKYLKDIDNISKDVGPDRLFLLINPFWRNVDSFGFNILQPNGKKRAQEVVFDNGYDVTYAVLRISARGEDCVAVKAYPYDWQMYAYREDPSWFNKQIPIWLGSSEEEPKSAQITELLNARPEFKMSKNMRQMQRMMGNDDQ